MFIGKSILFRLRSLALMPDGSLFLLRSGGDIGTAKGIFIDKEYDNFAKPSTGEVVIDVGAHIGLYAIKASKLVGKNGFIVAIEPDEENFKFLVWNLRINRVKNIIPVRCALGDFSGFSKFYVSFQVGHGAPCVIR